MSRPFIYDIFFLYIEPVSALTGAYFAYFSPSEYLSLTSHSAVPLSLQLAPSTTITIVLAQLANLYLLFAINEAFVLRSTNDIKVWKTVLLGLLIADLGHLWSVKGMGTDVYWNVAKWNAMDAGNIGFVYLGAAMRSAFIWGVGLGSNGDGKTKIG